MKITCQLVLFFAVLTFYSCKKTEPDSPLIDFSYSNNIGLAPDTVSFHATVKNTSSVQWFFGDGATGEGIDVKHVYTHSGYYSVQAIATGDGGSLSRFKNVNVSPYTKLRITSLSTTVPPLKPDGTTWDMEPNPNQNNPDLRIIIYNSSGVEIMNDQYAAYNVFSATFGYPTPAVVTDFEGSFKVEVYDYDNPSTLDFIGAILFRPADYMTDTTAAFPTNFLKNNGMGLSVGVNVAWGN